MNYELWPCLPSGSAAIPFASLRAGPFASLRAGLAASSRSEGLRARRPRSRSYGFLLALGLFAARAPAAQNPASAPLEIEYHLRLLRPSTHLAEVEIVARRVTEPSLDFAMPAWSPGRYAIYDFAKNVQEFEALDAASHSLPWTQTDKQTWRVDARDSGGAVRVRYKVFGNDLNGSFSQFDSTHANLNGASVYMYVAGH